jgi:hypothetical protein
MRTGALLPEFLDEPDRLADMPAARLASALNDAKVSDAWVIAQEIRAQAYLGLRGGNGLDPQHLRRGRNQAFQNLVVGTIAERVFRGRDLADLEVVGFIVCDLHERGESRDYTIERDGLELPINVKVASTLFRNARQTVGLDPEDCVPISTYKAIGACERVPDLVYVDLVDFTLREKVDAFMHALEGSLALAWALLSWYGGPGVKRAQDEYVATLFGQHGNALLKLAPGVASYRVISAQRVLAIMRTNPRRVPGLGVKAAGTGTFNAEVNVHVSVERETVAWDDVAEMLRRDGIQAVLDRIRQTEPCVQPAPTL